MKPGFKPKHPDPRTCLFNCCILLPLIAAVSWTGWLVAKIQRSARCLVVANEVWVQKLPSCPGLQRKPHFFGDVLCSRKAKVRGMSLIVCVCDSYTAKESLPSSEPDEFPRGARMPLKPCWALWGSKSGVLKGSQLPILGPLRAKV